MTKLFICFLRISSFSWLLSLTISPKKTVYHLDYQKQHWASTWKRCFINFMLVFQSKTKIGPQVLHYVFESRFRKSKEWLPLIYAHFGVRCVRFTLKEEKLKIWKETFTSVKRFPSEKRASFYNVEGIFSRNSVVDDSKNHAILWKKIVREKTDKTAKGKVSTTNLGPFESLSLYHWDLPKAI